MSRHGNSGIGSYPLAGSSRARRRLAINQAIADYTEPEILHSGSDVAVEISETEMLNTRATAQQFPSIDRSSPGLQSIRQLIDARKPITWVFTGDSTTHGARFTGGRRSYLEHFSERLRWEMRRLLDVVINTGVIGEHSASLLKNIEWRALRFKPDIVSVFIGLNDCKAGATGRDLFRDNLEMIVAALQDSGAIVLLNTPNTIPLSNSSKYVDLPAYVDIIRDVASQLDLPLVDHWSHWENVNPDEKDLVKWLSSDQVHPGFYGHRAMAKLLFKTLGIFDPRSPTCSIPVP